MLVCIGGGAAHFFAKQKPDAPPKQLFQAAKQADVAVAENFPAENCGLVSAGELLARATNASRYYRAVNQ